MIQIRLKQLVMSNSKILLAFIVGIAAGAVLGVLFAPSSGSDSRKELKNKAKDLADSILAKAEEIINSAEEAASKARAEKQGA